ncbi:MAG: glycerol kinase GlpK [Spirochaetales bacterium]|nr:glycerol kinase GlpK [Spirochaetales bacterium]
MDKSLILAIDQGTSGSKAVIFDRNGEIISDGRAPLESLYPREGYVEQRGEDIYSSVLEAVANSVEQAESKGFSRKDIRCCGISNQRETFILWDKKGKPLHNAVVWQCKRSIQTCLDLKSAGHEETVRKKTGLFLDPYFSGTKAAWLKNNDAATGEALRKGEAFFGTVDSWLLYCLTGGKEYKTDYSNASRTLFFNLGSLNWDSEILEIFGLGNLNLPEALPSDSEFGSSDFNGILPQEIPISGILGDSHAAAFGERCFEPGDAKATMGTGSSILMNTGDMVSPDDTKMVSTICWSTKNKVSYALEGIIVSCGSTLNWISSKLGFFKDGREADTIAMSLEDNGNVYLVPAFSGLGAPWWKMEAKGEIHGLTFGTDKKHIVRAGLESISYQVTDVIKAMKKDSGTELKSLQIDGGISASPFIQDMLGTLLPLDLYRCTLKEASALGAAFIAGLGAGIYESVEEIGNLPYNRKQILKDQNKIYEESYIKWLTILEELS